MVLFKLNVLGMMFLQQGEAGFDLRSMMGVPQILFMGIVALFWLIPIAVGIWAIITLARLRSGQERIQLKLEMLERMLQRGSGQ